jgi:hypothetical protein
MAPFTKVFTRCNRSGGTEVSTRNWCVTGSIVLTIPDKAAVPEQKTYSKRLDTQTGRAYQDQRTRTEARTEGTRGRLIDRG